MHRLNSLICTPKKWHSHNGSRSQYIGKTNQAEFFAFDKFTLQNLANKSGDV